LLAALNTERAKQGGRLLAKEDLPKIRYISSDEMERFRILDQEQKNQIPQDQWLQHHMVGEHLKRQFSILESDAQKKYLMRTYPASVLRLVREFTQNDSALYDLLDTDSYDMLKRIRELTPQEMEQAKLEFGKPAEVIFKEQVIQTHSYPKLEVIRQAKQDHQLVENALDITYEEFTAIRDLKPAELAAKKAQFEEQVKRDREQEASVRYVAPKKEDVVQQYSSGQFEYRPAQLEFARTFDGDKQLLEYALGMRHGVLDVARSLSQAEIAQIKAKEFERQRPKFHPLPFESPDERQKRFALPINSRAEDNALPVLPPKP
jgi:hypothetical protein